jgi:hypothetical protein
MTFDELRLKPGDKVRYIADHSMKGVEIEIPNPDRMILKADFGAWVSISNDGEKLSFMEKGWCWGDVDKWELVNQ